VFFGCELNGNEWLLFDVCCKGIQCLSIIQACWHGLQSQASLIALQWTRSVLSLFSANSFSWICWPVWTTCVWYCTLVLDVKLVTHSWLIGKLHRLQYVKTLKTYSVEECTCLKFWMKSNSQITTWFHPKQIQLFKVLECFPSLFYLFLI